ncbi:MAG: hypothetical protein PHN89_02700 [Candidatus Pacebacteria bacterium]|nr:hypothetical protein [Candidatus Paceibacterota bacterium]
MAEIVAQNTSITDEYYEDISKNNYSKWGQSFQCNQYTKLYSAKFFLRRGSDGGGNVRAKLYSHGGTFGTSSVADILLATSDDFNILSISKTEYTECEFIFSGVNRYVMTEDEYYVIVYENLVDPTNNTRLRDNWSSVCDGNACGYISDWSADSTKDVMFKVYGESPVVEGLAQVAGKVILEKADGRIGDFGKGGTGRFGRISPFSNRNRRIIGWIFVLGSRQKRNSCRNSRFGN